MTIAELKGLAVRHMNSDPVIALRGGVEIPRNFVLDSGVLGGLPGLRFGDSTWLLKVDSMPAGVSSRYTGREAYLLVESRNPSEIAIEVGRQFGWRPGSVRFYEIHLDCETAVHAAATMAAGLVFIQKALARAVERDNSRCASVGERVQDEGTSFEDDSQASDVLVDLNMRTEPPSVQTLREIGEWFARGLTSTDSVVAWEDIVVEERVFEGQPVVEVDREVLIALLGDLPAELAADEDIPQSADGRRPAMAVIGREQRAIVHAIAAALPGVPWVRWTPISVHPGWFPAFAAAVAQQICRRHENRARDALRGRKTVD